MLFGCFVSHVPFARAKQTACFFNRGREPTDWRLGTGTETAKPPDERRGLLAPSRSRTYWSSSPVEHDMLYIAQTHV